MNGNTAITAKAERLSDAARLAAQWKITDWKLAEAEVNRLQKPGLLRQLRRRTGTQ